MNKLGLESALANKETSHSVACWALVERIVASPQLKRAARLREFLLYVGQRTLKDGLDQVHEQEIGFKVFGRAAEYDTSLDNIVRVNASELRKRIEDYFETDGASETLVLEIPRGSYKPVFRERLVETAGKPAGEPPVMTEPTSAEPTSGSPPLVAAVKPTLERWILAMAAVLILALGAGCFYQWNQIRALRQLMSVNSWQSTPVVAAFWTEILGARQNTDIILADTSFALVQDITRRSVPLSDYLSRNYANSVQSAKLSADRRLDLEMIMRRNNGSLGDFRAAQKILALDPAVKSFHLYSARDYTPALVNQDNLILVGARKSNPWVDLFAGNMNFVAEYDIARSMDYISNRAPAAGEQAAYTPPLAPATGGYCVVAYLPNPQQPGKVLIIAGTDSAATEGGGNFLTSEDQLSSFRKTLNVKTLPYFEVVLRTSNLNGTPINAKIVAYRTYPSGH